ncbi:hypothetical protein, partial [Shewanella sairae]|uniref:hypothetical protein n=1 Tax=Shewanella sairae TaxID=190310 RepID=UPI001C82614B
IAPCDGFNRHRLCVEDKPVPQGAEIKGCAEYHKFCVNDNLAKHETEYFEYEHNLLPKRAGRLGLTNVVELLCLHL